MVNFVVLCGGSGSRLWPKSRSKLPKQFLKMTNDHTMLQNTLLRILTILNKTENIKTDKDNNKIIIICNKDHSHIVELQVNEMKLPINVLIIDEPKGRDSAPAICIASIVDEEDQHTFIMPCDHLLEDEKFVQSYLESIPYLDTSIITFGIKPDRIETGYGYIKTNSAFKTERFIEKPNYENAKRFFEDPSFLWNAGIFAFKNKNMIKCFQKYCPDILENCILTLENSNAQLNIIHLSEDPFVNCRSISIDYSIMEPLCADNDIDVQKITIPYIFHWNDLGSFSSVFDECVKDSDNNVLKGDIEILQSKNCYIEGEDRLITAINVENLLIIDTSDALLVCNKESSQNVKQIVDTLKQNKRDEIVYHKKVFRPWGWFKNIEGLDNGKDGFKVKRIAVYPGKRLSLQSHNFRSEHWVIVKGKAKVTLDNNEFYLERDQNIYIPLKTLHRIENIGQELLEFTETQIGDYLGEDDIIRYEDDFGRL
jgi:mannose-1-phosphate guanylyltransferase